MATSPPTGVGVGQKKCMYCWELKPADQMTLEHAIPQSLGGAQAPLRYKVRAACKKCNNCLGLYVDARFEKSMLPSLALAEAARFLALAHPGVIPPLVCMGTVHLKIPGMLESEVCEWWNGSQGEHVFLIRPSSEDFYGYLGGNPITLKQASANARAYYFFNEAADPLKTLLEFQNSFKRRKVRRVSGTEVNGISLGDYGFSTADEKDQEAISYLWNNAFSGEIIQGTVPFSSDFDTRFMCKLALAIGYSELGEAYLDSDWARRLHEGLWYQGDGPIPDMPGMRPFNSPENVLLQRFTGEPGAVCLLVKASEEHLTVTLNIHQKHVWGMVVAARSEIPQDHFERLEDGRLISLYAPIDQGHEKAFPEYLADRLHPNEP